MEIESSSGYHVPKQRNWHAGRDPFIYSLIHLFIPCFSYVPGTVLYTGVTVSEQTSKAYCVLQETDKSGKDFRSDREDCSFQTEGCSFQSNQGKPH